MAAGSSRILRYLLFAFFGVMVLYFISSSSIPRPPIPAIPTEGFNWKGSTEGPTVEEVGGEKPGALNGQITSTAAAQASVASSQPVGTEAPMSPKPSAGLSHTVSTEGKMNATFVTLARNSDLWEIVKSIRQVEDRFNRNYHYDWVFLNDKPFDSTFKKVTSALISGTTHYEEIPEEHWSYPDFIDQEKARKVREDMAERKIIYGDSPIMNKFEWYWRVEPSIELYCDVTYDPFKFMADNKKKYSFVLSLYEYVETIPTLWDSTKTYMKNHPEHLAKGNAMEWLSGDDGETYNHCHFWSNFEIGNLNWLRSPAYIDFFEQLDKDGGFFYERWGDAPVHSIAAALTLKKEEIHFFNDIAYYHVPFTHCPTGDQFRLDHKCHCNPKDNFDWKGYSCTARWFDLNKMEKPEGWEDEKN
ncbi:MAG: hypothetical protein Q9195_001462 [Heterodermia aff. obscurata]